MTEETNSVSTLTSKRPVIIQAAVADNHVIGVDGGLPWDLPEDFEAFLASTSGGIVVLGRRGFEGWPECAADGRQAIVVSTTADAAALSAIAAEASPSASAVIVARSLSEALTLADALPGRTGDPVHICGGARIYAEALKLSSTRRPLRLRLTLVHASPRGDTHFPSYANAARWREISRRPSFDPVSKLSYTFIEWEYVDELV